VRFAKLHGAGNDFLLFDSGSDAALKTVLAGLTPRLCDRRLGIGADGTLLVEPVGEREVRLGYWNADGSAALFCANGTRCAARWAAERWGWPRLVLHTGYADVPAEVEGVSVRLDLPAPTAIADWTSFHLPTGPLRARYLVVGVPHLVVPVDWIDFWQHPLANIAPALRSHPALPPGGANVSFVRSGGEGELWVRSWERGVEAETLSCGSGDVAAGLVTAGEGWFRFPVPVRTASGRVLTVFPEGCAPSCGCALVGPAEWVADGEIAAELLADASEATDRMTPRICG
jgi:diaminopimelate epimerase